MIVPPSSSAYTWAMTRSATTRFLMAAKTQNSLAPMEPRGTAAVIETRRMQGDCTMTGMKIIVALALLFGATSISLAQSQRNYGPNGPSKFGCYGEPFSGSAGSRCPGSNGYYGHHWRHHY
jgi:hypothetical protein